MKQGTKEWFEARKGRVTGSVAGAILGLSPFQTRDDIMRMMVREFNGCPEPLDDFLVNTIFAYGHRNEPIAIEQYELTYNTKTYECGFYPYEDWLGASPDRVFNDDRTLMEVKCPYSKRNDKGPLFDCISDNYYAQVQIELLCSDVTECKFFQWAPGGSSLVKIYYDSYWINENIPKLRDFYDEYIIERTNLKSIHLQPKLMVIDNPDVKKLLKEYDELKDQEDYLKERKVEIIEMFAEATGDSDALICGRKFTKVAKKGSISYATIVKERLPNLKLDSYRGKGSLYWKLT